jgi:eukaryotic-like serine/threonine-protein kinase
MTLEPRIRLGPYEVVAPLGAGGMGEVYRARDTRLDREVALKVLPATFASDSALRQRLQTEARTISQLSHPHICTLFDVGEEAGTAFLVMELIDGETLAGRLARQGGGALPLDEALRIGGQIAQALAAAHSLGIVHRDLKPGNVMLARTRSPSSGPAHVKLLDFGLAKMVQRVAPANISSLPTTPPLPLTVEGTILGTIQYMAPEQIEGVEADGRADIFALGCVLYEMLTGARAFEGRSQAGIMAAILEREPVSIATRQSGVPPLVAGIVERCLAKSSDDRWQSAADLATALSLAAGGAGATTAAPAEPRHPPRTLRKVAVAGGLAVMFAAGALAWRYLAPAAAPSAKTWFEIAPPQGVTWSPSPVASTAQLALSPDGRRLAFVAAPRRGTPQIWIRSLDSLQAQPLPDTDDAAFPFWSADGRSIAFFAGGKLKRIDIAGGAAQVLAETPLARGGSWNRDDVILFTPAPNRGIWRIPASGGTATPVTTLSAASRVTNHVWPQFLADGRRFIFYQRSDEPEHQGIYLSSLDSADSSQVVRNDGIGIPAQGHVLLVREGTLFAQAIDPQTMAPRGEAVRVADGVGYTLGTIGYSPVSAADTTLAYGPSVRVMTALQWHDRAGTPVGPVLVRGVVRSPRLAPDGRRLALTMIDERATSPDVWILDIARGTFTRVTSHAATDWFPAWSHQGDRLFFGSARMRATTVFEKDLSSSAGESVVIPTDVARYPVDSTMEGGVVFQTGSSDGYDLGVADRAQPPSPAPIVATPFNEVQGRVSPDNRWIAYASDESGRFEVYVRSFPSAKGQWTISPAGGMQPEWRRDGRELYYVSSDRKLMAVPVTTDGDSFSAGVPQPLFDIDLPVPTAPYPGDYAVSADGQRFLVNTVVDQPDRSSLSIVLNWAGTGRP